MYLKNIIFSYYLKLKEIGFSSDILDKYYDNLDKEESFEFLNINYTENFLN